MAKSIWMAFPLEASAFSYEGAALKKAWSRLHAGDLERFPDTRRAKSLIDQLGSAAPEGLTAASLAGELQEAWRAFHRGDFKKAFESGQALGPAGASVTVKALGIHATRLVDDKVEKLKQFQLASQLAEAALRALPNDANNHYRHAFALGRYGQGLSIAKALQSGVARKMRQALDAAMAREPNHAEGHTAFAVYHAEIISKVGALIGGLTYGAKATEAESHIRTALKLTPTSPIAHVEHGNVLLLLHGDKGEDKAAAAYEIAAKLTPLDAMEALDVAYAQAQLE